jgi:hypothetical protein
MSNYEITKTLSITKNGMLELFYDALCGGSIGFGCVTLDCEQEVYDNARERVKILKAATPEDYIVQAVCYEDVMTEVLRAGDKLFYMEYDEYDDQNNKVEFDLDHLMDNFHSVESWVMEQMLSEDFDSITTDSLLQGLLLGEIVYG